MPIPNVSSLYHRIYRGAEGGHEFARFIKMLLKADYESQGVNFISESDASGDYKKVDGYISGDVELPEFTTVFQYKFYPSKLSSSQKNEMVKSLRSALEENQLIQKYIFVTPEDFLKEQLTWFESLKIKFKNTYWLERNGKHTKGSLELFHWGIQRLLNYALNRITWVVNIFLSCSLLELANLNYLLQKLIPNFVIGCPRRMVQIDFINIHPYIFLMSKPLTLFLIFGLRIAPVIYIY